MVSSKQKIAAPKGDVAPLKVGDFIAVKFCEKYMGGVIRSYTKHTVMKKPSMAVYFTDNKKCVFSLRSEDTVMEVGPRGEVYEAAMPFHRIALDPFAAANVAYDKEGVKKAPKKTGNRQLDMLL